MTLGVDGQVGTAMRGDGSTGHAETSASVVDTSRTYAVGAWVRLAHTDGFATVVNQDGDVVSGFYLQYVKDENRWSFSLTNADAVQGGVRVKSLAPPEVGEWTHLLGVYDAVAKKATLYVNGVPQEEKPFTVTWNATGPMAIGRAKHNSAAVDFFPGEIDDVQVYDRLVSAEEAADLFTRHPVLSGRWTLNTDGQDGAGGWQVEMPGSDASGAVAQRAEHSAYQSQLDWDHVAIVYDSFADVLRLYVNGWLEETEERVSARWHTIGFDATGPLQLGRTKTAGAWGEHWSGVIDDVWAFSGVLTQEQIQTLAGYTELPSDSPF
ncbi:LamG domain-containing protein [Nonomuraea harbinensis]|uniref:LamG-like jellyroll fold domain-containing protein n=1 Tax=Nonomuraea harbinensis TaxID=1286938 RepID=A0ABW1C431_9ACTN|nr:LamG domain-containing protein [Nonomuraea harbinensis]